MHFNPRSPCGERLLRSDDEGARLPFQSTLPVWGATTAWANSSSCRQFQSTLPVWGATATLLLSDRCLRISIHAPRVGSDRSHYAGPYPQAISIHAPRVGSDCHLTGTIPLSILFQSTLPVWGATYPAISGTGCRSNFNPRSPCGERPAGVITRPPPALFQSTLPVWGATMTWTSWATSWPFQSTLPVWGATV